MGGGEGAVRRVECVRPPRAPLRPARRRGAALGGAGAGARRRRARRRRRRLARPAPGPARRRPRRRRTRAAYLILFFLLLWVEFQHELLELQMNG